MNGLQAAPGPGDWHTVFTVCVLSRNAGCGKEGQWQQGGDTGILIWNLPCKLWSYEISRKTWFSFMGWD